MRFLVDAQLPPALARLLSAHGLPAEHVMDLGMESASDSKILRHAADTGCAIVTKDDDFIHLVAVAPHVPPVVWIRVGNTSRRALLQWFEPLIPRILDALERGEQVIELI
jgi:predicted nuclease of predicted toxin-antitoxin system